MTAGLARTSASRSPWGRSSRRNMSMALQSCCTASTMVDVSTGPIAWIVARQSCRTATRTSSGSLRIDSSASSSASQSRRTASRTMPRSRLSSGGPCWATTRQPRGTSFTIWSQKPRSKQLSCTYFIASELMTNASSIAALSARKSSVASSRAFTSCDAAANTTLRSRRCSSAAYSRDRQLARTASSTKAPSASSPGVAKASARTDCRTARSTTSRSPRSASAACRRASQLPPTACSMKTLLSRRCCGASTRISRFFLAASKSRPSSAWSSGARQW
mmetsp:Transcript_8259/g.22407  ORF Transcript_8259/g.22407 Transcript_8259/m.22407 type:complete len:276 (+) Transcript_8259:632-1459(+)